MKTIIPLERQYLDSYWKDIKPLLEKGLQLCQGELTIDQMRLLIAQGMLNVIVALERETNIIVGALAFEIVLYPNYRVANIVSIGGSHLLTTEEDLEQFSFIMKKTGCSKVQGWCSPANAKLWKRKFGFTTPYTMVRFDLGEKL